jgi:hypothetical protein
MWRSQKQTCTALSTNEAEYIAASDASRDALWMRNIVRDLGLIVDSPFPPMIMHIDNAGAQAMAEDTLTTKRSKHVDVRYHYIQEKVHDGVIELQHCHTADQLADGLTKPLRVDKFERFRAQIGVGRIIKPDGQPDGHRDG